MVPTAYHAFFGGCASVAGTLIGLLFMADPDRELANAPFDLLPAARTPVTVVDTAEIEVFSGVQFS